MHNSVEVSGAYPPLGSEYDGPLVKSVDLQLINSTHSQSMA